VTEPTAWPRKTRELHNHHMDSTVWNGFRFRPGDVVVATYGKSGTTWVQQVVGQLLLGGREDVDVPELSPWLDLRVPPKEVKLAALEAQRHRRFVKTHLPVDALVFSPDARYLYVGPRRARRGLEPIQPPRQRQRALVPGAQRHAGPGRPADRAGRRPTSAGTSSIGSRATGTRFWSFWENVASWWAVTTSPAVA
jgi:aryl sulfotransferase